MNWISIKKRLPRSNQLVVLAHKRSDVGIDVICSNGAYARKWCQKGFYTHWLPLPRHPHRQEMCTDIETMVEHPNE